MSIRITITAPDAEQASEFKERFFKDLYNHSGNKVTFEVPEGDDKIAEIEAAAKEAGFEVASEKYEEPIEDAEPVDFW